ncbi:hypothetical protein [Pseudomonas sp. 18173]|uniref:hypothetical protein n=1 Tax=Pseudomonas sp. 18173 TaxID=3390055 RepID=UPI003D20DBD7
MVIKPKIEQPNISPEEAKALLEKFNNPGNLHTHDQIRDQVFSTLTVGTTIFHPYWFAVGTEYSHDVWHQELPDGHGGVYVRTIDFRVRLPNGLLLTHQKNRKLLAFIRYMMAIQVHPRFNGSFYKPTYAQSLLTKALYVADWILLNVERFKVSEYDLGIINKNDYTYFLTLVADLPINEAVYNFPSRTEKYIRQEIQSINEHDFAEAIKIEPRLKYLAPESTRRLNLTEDEIVRAHYIFWKKGWYRANRGALVLNNSDLLRVLYKDTLHGMNQRPTRFEELDAGREYYATEFDAVEVRRGYHEGLCNKELRVYIDTLRKAQSFESNDSFHIDKQAILSLSVKSILAGRTRKPDGRFSTLPLEVIGSVLHNSLEFIICHTDNILEHMLCALQKHQLNGATKKLSINESYKPLTTLDSDFPSPTRWSLYRNSPSFYSDLRNGVGLSELYQVLVGAACITICSLSARRRSELIRLDSQTCLKPDVNPNNKKNQNIQYNLEFQPAKTGAGDQRETISRPIPRVVAKIIYSFQQFNKKLAELGITPSKRHLFQSINRHDGRVTNGSEMGIYDSFDMASDYFQSECVVGEDGVRRRHYVRPHQLRRFFAMVFFNSSSEFKTPAISWMLGHTDLSSFYRYVTEVVGGRAMNEAKAYALHKAVADSVNNPIQNIDSLMKKLKLDYNTKAIHIKTSKEINEDLAYLSSENLVELEPTFEEYLRGENIEYDLLCYLRQGEISLDPSFFDIKDKDGSVIHKFTLLVKVTDLDD